MYYQYFGLSEAPFSIAVNPRYLFMSARHRDALAHLLYGVGAGGGFILLTGEVGTGKTTINRCLLEQLPENTDIAIILNPALDAMELLASACDELSIDYDPDRPTFKALTDKLHAFLLENHRSGRKTVLMIDEAQHLNFEVLEQIRLLTNLETNHEKLLQIILIGQPELAQMLKQPQLRQLNQRITARYNLEPLDQRETAAYIRHRLQVAGLPADRELFPPAVVKNVYRLSRGVPRLINLLCDRTLLGAYGRNREGADTEMLRIAAREVMGDTADQPTAGSRGLLILGGLLGVALLSGLVWSLWPSPGPGSAGSQPPLTDQTPKQSTLTEIAATPPVNPPQEAVFTDTASAAVSAQPTTEESAELSQPDWVLSPKGAASALWTLTTARPEPPQLCAPDSSQDGLGPVCVTADAGAWSRLRDYDRPLLLSLSGTEPAAAAILLGLRGNTALLWSDGAAVVTVARDTLAPLWDGRISYLWHPPAQFRTRLTLWDESDAVAEVAALFAEFDEQPTALTGSVFNRDLQARVRLFQRRYGLTPDGDLSLPTLLKLNELLGIDPTRAEVLNRLGYSDEGPSP